jgi:peptidoglycan hydrolase-like protein with peptidoglycan-binding domain
MQNQLIAIAAVILFATGISAFAHNRDLSGSRSWSDNPNFVRIVENVSKPIDRAGETRRVQERLIELGYLGGPADGVWGANSRAGLRAFKAANGLSINDKLDEPVKTRLFSTSAVRAPVPLAPEQSPVRNPLPGPSEAPKLRPSIQNP